jgi:hypothetical protein
MSVLSLLHSIYLAMEQVSTGLLSAQQVLQDQKRVVDVGRHHISDEHWKKARGSSKELNSLGLAFFGPPA